MRQKKVYLGDSVYAEKRDGFWAGDTELVLTTENGGQPSNTIVLEPAVYRQLKEFMNGQEG